MFKKLTDFSYKRNGKEAVGFYLAYLVVSILLAMIIKGLYDGPMHDWQRGFSEGISLTTLTEVLFSMGLFLIILKAKKMHKRYMYVILVLLSGVLATFGGSVLGLIFPTLLTTKPNGR